MSIEHELLDSDYWRKRAEESRAQANQLHDRVTKALALRIADLYEEMAGRAAERGCPLEKPGPDSN